RRLGGGSEGRGRRGGPGPFPVARPRPCRHGGRGVRGPLPGPRQPVGSLRLPGQGRLRGRYGPAAAARSRSARASPRVRLERRTRGVALVVRASVRARGARPAVVGAVPTPTA